MPQLKWMEILKEVEYAQKAVLGFILFVCLFEFGKEWGSRSKDTSEKNIICNWGKKKTAPQLFLGKWGFYQALQKKKQTTPSLQRLLPSLPYASSTYSLPPRNLQSVKADTAGGLQCWGPGLKWWDNGYGWWQSSLNTVQPSSPSTAGRVGAQGSAPLVWDQPWQMQIPD